MKRINILSVILLWFCGININAQKDSPHVFSLSGGFGLSSLQYKPEKGNHDPGIGGNIGIGYTYMLAPQWGIGSGLELAFHNSQCDMETLQDSQNASGDEGAFLFKSVYTRYHEKQEVAYLNIPLMVLYQAKSRLGFYAAGGVKLGIPIYGKFESSGDLTTSGWFEYENQEYENMPDRGFGVYKNAGDNGKLDLKINMALSLEMGFKWALAKGWALHTGIFADYGMVNIRDGSNTRKPVEYQSANPSEFAYSSITATGYVKDLTTLTAGIKVRVLMGGGR